MTHIYVRTYYYFIIKCDIMRMKSVYLDGVSACSIFTNLITKEETMRWLCFDAELDKYTSDHRTRKKDVYELAKVSFLYNFERKNDVYTFAAPYISDVFKSTDYMEAFAQMKRALEAVAIKLTGDATVIQGCCVTPAVNYETSIMKWRIDDS